MDYGFAFTGMSASRMVMVQAKSSSTLSYNAEFLTLPPPCSIYINYRILQHLIKGV